MTPTPRQQLLVRMIGQMVDWATRHGYGLSIVGPKTDDSLEFSLKAIMLGKRIETLEHYRYLGEYWESMGGKWGGRLATPEPSKFWLERERVK